MRIAALVSRMAFKRKRVSKLDKSLWELADKIGHPVDQLNGQIVFRKDVDSRTEFWFDIRKCIASRVSAGEIRIRVAIEEFSKLIPCKNCYYHFHQCLDDRITRSGFFLEDSRAMDFHPHTFKPATATIDFFDTLLREPPRPNCGSSRCSTKNPLPRETYVATIRLFVDNVTMCVRFFTHSQQNPSLAK
jgi:hypothetical protein